MVTKKVMVPISPKPHDLRTRSVWDAEIRSPKFLATLARLGSLPAILSLPEIMSLIALVMKEIDQEAVRWVLVRAALAHEIRFWDRTFNGAGKWKPDTITLMRELSQKPRLLGDFVALTLEPGCVLIDRSMGLHPPEVGYLLRDRAYNVPEELLHYLIGPEVAVESDALESPPGGWRHNLHQRAQAVGKALQQQNSDTTNGPIAKAIVRMLSEEARENRTGHKIPAWTTVLKALTGWRFDPT